MVAQLFSEYFRGVLLARYEEGEAVEETERQTDRQTDRQGDRGDDNSDLADRVFTRFRLFRSNDIVFVCCVWNEKKMTKRKQKTEKKIKNAKTTNEMLRKICG